MQRVAAMPTPESFGSDNSEATPLSIAADRATLPHEVLITGTTGYVGRCWCGGLGPSAAARDGALKDHGATSPAPILTETGSRHISRTGSEGTAIMPPDSATLSIPSKLKPLVVDLDGTLVRSDLLVESAFADLG